MPTSKNANGEENRLKEHPLVSALVPEPGEGPPDAAVLRGYLGRGKDKGWRLYLDAALSSYVELSEDDILHHKELANDAGNVVWVSKSLELKVTRVSSTTMQAEFLSGAIAAGRMRPSRRANAATPAALPRTVGCPSILNNCSSQILPCPSDGCVTWDSCPTEIDWCRPSEFSPLCTIAVL